MGFLGKSLGLAGLAAGGIAAAKGLLGNKKRQLAELDTEFAKTTKSYLAKKSKLESKIENGNLGATKKLKALELDYFVKKAEYENQRKTLLPPKSKVDEERESQAFEQRLEIEKAKVLHELELEKSKTMYGLELEKDKNQHGWHLETTKTIYDLELEKDKNQHKLNLEQAQSLHNMEMEKMELTSKLGICSTEFNTTQNIDNIIVCSNCGNINKKGSKFCNNCGKALNIKRSCTVCGAEFDANSKFCSMCGHSVENL